MRLLALLLLSLCPLVRAQQVNTDIVPASTGLNVGHSNQRWNGFFQVMDISSAMSKLSIANAGVFTNTQTNQYFTSLINGIPADMYHSVQGFSGFTTEAGSFGIAVPVSAAIGEADALVGMVTSACPSFSRTTCNTVAVSGHARAIGNNAAVWGQNTTVDNATGTTGTNIIGNEIDIGVRGNQSAGYVHGLDIFLTPQPGSTMPTNTSAVGMTISDSISANGAWFDGMYIQGVGINSSGNAIYIDQNCSSGPCSSPKVTLAGIDGGNVLHNGSWSVDSSGNNVFAGGFLQSTNGLKAGASGSTISDTRELIQSAHLCGVTTTCANTANQSTRMIYGAIALSGGTATITGITPFTSTSTMFCFGTDFSAANAVKVLAASSSSITVTGTGTDSVYYACIGN